MLLSGFGYSIPLEQNTFPSKLAKNPLPGRAVARDRVASPDADLAPSDTATEIGILVHVGNPNHGDGDIIFAPIHRLKLHPADLGRLWSV